MKKMLDNTSLKANIIANMAGNVWASALALILVPFYVHFMGVESYGLVGFFSLMVAILALLDFGLSPTLNREIARQSVLPCSGDEIRDLLRTIETISWIISILAGLSVVVMATSIAKYWVRTEVLPISSVCTTLHLMGLTLVFQLPIGVYSAGLMGLQKQVLLNAISIVMLTIKGLVAIIVLWKVAPTIEVFFLWQAIASMCHVALLHYVLWSRMPYGATTRRVFNPDLLKLDWRFTASAGVSGILQAVLGNMDKVILSKWLSLESFGCYSVASLISVNLSRIVTPFSVTLFPRFAQLIASGDSFGLTKNYHRYCQLISGFTLPIMAMVALFPKEVLWIWTHDSIVAEQAGTVLVVMIIGASLINITTLPVLILVSYGWMRFSVISQCLGVLIMLPAMMMAARSYGSFGVALVYALWQCSMVVITPIYVHGRVMTGERKKWYSEDVLYPLVTALFLAWSLRMLFMPAPIVRGMPMSILGLFVMGLIVFAGTLVSLPEMRLYMLSWSKKLIFRRMDN